MLGCGKKKHEPVDGENRHISYVRKKKVVIVGCQRRLEDSTKSWVDKVGRSRWITSNKWIDHSKDTNMHTPRHGQRNVCLWLNIPRRGNHYHDRRKPKLTWRPRFELPAPTHLRRRDRATFRQHTKHLVRHSNGPSQSLACWVLVSRVARMRAAQGWL
jgi:hypothetical protein